MNKFLNNPVWVLLSVVTALLVFSCATSPAPDGEIAPEPTVTQAPAGDASGFAVEEGPLALAVRRMGEQYREGVVLMAGVDAVTPAQTFEAATADVVVAWLAETAGLLRTQDDGYTFLYPDTYGLLNDVSLEGELPQSLNDLRAAVSFGTGTPLFDALAFLSATLNVALVADHAVAEAPLGEVALDVSPLPVILEALLKSARVSPDAFEVEAAPAYVFIRSVANPAQRKMFLNEDALGEAAKSVLSRRVNIALPARSRDPEVMIGRYGAQPLGELLPELSRQLGIRVRATKGVEMLPVNPMVLPDVTVRTALDLIVAQWPVADFGYQLDADGVLIRAAAQ